MSCHVEKKRNLVIEFRLGEHSDVHTAAAAWGCGTAFFVWTRNMLARCMVLSSEFQLVLVPYIDWLDKKRGHFTVQ